MPCNLCDWLGNLLGVSDKERNCIWYQADRWEDDFAQKWEPWDDDESRRLRASAAAKLVEIDSQAGLREFLELSELGSAWSMRWVGHLYSGAHGIERNAKLAEDYFRKALCAGSWLATIPYANCLYRRGAHDKWPSTLADGVDRGFVPAFYWQAWNHYRLSPSRKTAQEMRPLLQRAAREGHPGAKALLARWSMRGRFGFGQIWRGLRMSRELVYECAKWSAQSREQAAVGTSG